ncbi:MAG: hypothetical protein AB2401_01505 [Bacillus sp. (in: firmicutes)]|jgi:hypothetical protein
METNTALKLFHIKLLNKWFHLEQQFEITEGFIEFVLGGDQNAD